MESQAKRTIGGRPREMSLALAALVAALLLFALAGSSRRVLAAMVLLAAGGILSWGWAIRKLRARPAVYCALERLRALAPGEFAAWVRELFGDLGYAVRALDRGGEQAVYLFAERPGEAAVIQCRIAGHARVGEDTLLQDLCRVMADYGAGKAYLVTSGSLAPAARARLKGRPIKVWDGERLAGLSLLQSQGSSAMLPRLGAPMRKDGGARSTRRGG